MKTVCLGCREGKVVSGCVRGRGDRDGRPSGWRLRLGPVGEFLVLGRTVPRQSE